RGAGFGGRPLVCRPQQARALEPDTRGRAPAAREGREAEANPGPDPRNRGQSRGADTRAATPRRRAPGGARAKRGVAARQRRGGRCAGRRCGVGSRRADNRVWRATVSGPLIPPNDLDAEGACIAAVFFDPATFDEIALVLKPEHFYADANRRIWEAMAGLAAAGRPPDGTAVMGWLRGDTRAAPVGGRDHRARR